MPNMITFFRNHPDNCRIYTANIPTDFNNGRPSITTSCTPPPPSYPTCA